MLVSPMMGRLLTEELPAMPERTRRTEYHIIAVILRLLVLSKWKRRLKG